MGECSDLGIPIFPITNCLLGEAGSRKRVVLPKLCQVSQAVWQEPSLAATSLQSVAMLGPCGLLPDHATLCVSSSADSQWSCSHLFPVTSYSHGPVGLQVLGLRKPPARIVCTASSSSPISLGMAQDSVQEAHSSFWNATTVILHHGVAKFFELKASP